eukprot:TRINITY_DN1519_c0_g2_i2.p1 TRINITY_DN1519_c0_g2~~TRINITY_DN1519_c0_g2_i2.p1  ORF type:complete len:256 (-),score=38.58 TRINITY_DN1519_c0_g2_i2:3-770(-)
MSQKTQFQRKHRSLRDLDVTRCKRFSIRGSLPHIHSPRQRIIVFKNADPNVEILDSTSMLSFRKSRKRIKKFLTKKCVTIADHQMIRRVPRLLGPQPNKMGKFPSLFDISDIHEAIDSCRRNCQWRLKRDLTLSAIVGHSDMSSIQLFENVQAAIELLSPVLQNWQKLQSLVLKSSMGHPYFIFRRTSLSNPEKWMPKVRGHYSAVGSHRDRTVEHWKRPRWSHRRWPHVGVPGKGHAKKKTSRMLARKYKKDRY